MIDKQNLLSPPLYHSMRNKAVYFYMAGSRKKELFLSIKKENTVQAVM